MGLKCHALTYCNNAVLSTTYQYTSWTNTQTSNIGRNWNKKQKYKWNCGNSFKSNTI